jgi:hypothetical protein
MQGDVADLSTYFNVKKIRPNGSFVWEGITFELVQVIHIMNGYVFVPSFGLMFTVSNGDTPVKIFWTSDTQHAPNQIMDFYKQADLIFQDCETSFKSGVHAHYDDLKTLPADIKDKMWLYHYNKGKSQSPMDDGFLGFIDCRQEFIFGE